MDKLGSTLWNLLLVPEQKELARDPGRRRESGSMPAPDSRTRRIRSVSLGEGNLSFSSTLFLTRHWVDRVRGVEESQLSRPSADTFGRRQRVPLISLALLHLSLINLLSHTHTHRLVYCSRYSLERERERENLAFGFLLSQWSLYRKLLLTDDVPRLDEESRLDKSPRDPLMNE